MIRMIPLMITLKSRVKVCMVLVYEVSIEIGNADLVTDGILGLGGSGEGCGISEVAEPGLRASETTAIGDSGRASPSSEEIESPEDSRSIEYLLFDEPK